MAINILIIEDHPIVADGLQKLCSSNYPGSVCLVAGTGKKGLALLNGHKFDIILLDINLPDYDGTDLCAEIKAKFDAIKIVVLTSFMQRSYVEKMINAGASAYLNKNADTDEIIEGIETVLKGNSFFSKSVTEMMHHNSVSNSQVSVPSLTSREAQILSLVVEGLTNQEIADKLFISIQTAISHRKNLLIKFKARNTAELVRLSLQNNL